MIRNDIKADHKINMILVRSLYLSNAKKSLSFQMDNPDGTEVFLGS